MSTSPSRSEKAASGAFSDFSSDSAGKRRDPRRLPDAAKQSGTPWQLQMYEKSLKKRQKVELLMRLMGKVSEERCLLISGHDNNGAMNYHFRAAGGRWSWGQVYPQGIEEMAEFLGDPVAHVDINHFPFADAAFDVVIVIDVHEHFADLSGINREIRRVLAPGGLGIITTPNGDTRLPVALLKRLIGMGPATYGHVVQGYRIGELEQMFRSVAMRPVASGGYSRFFTEFAELVINFAYVKVLARKKEHPPVMEGTIAPTSRKELEAVRKEYRMYSLIYPFMYVFSLLDKLIPGRGGYAVAVAARR
ncbi:MAG TPA: class I SAM-dependent methyltransferase [Steroidobacteraceae bacterium]|nr:class I SAM-dependent methyltransferase [Steroidobacteraceae bacterium]